MQVRENGVQLNLAENFKPIYLSKIIRLFVPDISSLLTVVLSLGYTSEELK